MRSRSDPQLGGRAPKLPPPAEEVVCGVDPTPNLGAGLRNFLFLEPTCSFGNFREGLLKRSVGESYLLPSRSQGRRKTGKKVVSHTKVGCRSAEEVVCEAGQTPNLGAGLRDFPFLVA